MTPLVLMPWQDIGCPHRADAMGHTLAHWNRDHTLAVRVCRHPAGQPWRKADALASGVAAGPGDPWDIIIVADADCLVDPQAVAHCVQVVADGAPWAIPHWSVLRLTRAATERILGGGVPWHPAVLHDALEQAPYLGCAAGGVIVIRRDVALDVPMDGNYEGWGGEDYSWGLALDTLVGSPYRPPRDQPTPLIHLYHPRDPRSAHGKNLSSDEDRRSAYFSAWANHDVDRMRQLVEGGRRWPSPSPSSN